MKVLYLDCSAGASGDMFLGTLLDLGVPEEELRSLMDQLGIDGKLIVKEDEKRSIRGKKVVFEGENGKKRGLHEMKDILDSSNIDKKVKEWSKTALQKLAEAEAKVHGEDVDSIHFHELGNLDTIVDIAGTFHLLNQLGPDKIYASKVNLGRGGTIWSEHGELPNPAPATVELLEGIPTYSNIEGEETVTPTGAVLIGQTVDSFGYFPEIEIERAGYGLGSKDFPFPNVLRAFLGESPGSDDGEIGSDRESIVELEVNLDDCNPELLANATEKLFSKGAVEVWQEPIQMKKNRSGTKLVVLCDPERIPEMERVIFTETTSLGYRYQTLKKKGLEREIREVESKYGPLKVKLGYYGESVNIAPEFEDCRRAAEKQGASLKEVYREARKKAYELIDEEKTD